MTSKKLTFEELLAGDTFEVDPDFVDEWFSRGTWMKTDTGVAVCLTQGVSNQGHLRPWRAEVPVVLVKKRILPGTRRKPRQATISKGIFQ